MRRGCAAVVVLVALGGAGCGGGEDEGFTTGGATRLVVEVRDDGSGKPDRRTAIDCSEVSPAPECERLEPLSPLAFAPVRSDAVCTEIFGGPATARVSGTFRGKPLDEEFSRQNGCEISRWDRFGFLLGEASASG